MSADTPRPAALGPLAAVKLGLARAALAWEHLWPALWPAAAVAGLFAVAVLMDLLPRLGGAVHATALLAFLGALAVALWRGLRRLRLPGDTAARRRLETASNMPHRPLETLADELAAGRRDPVAEALWRAHRRRALQGIARLRVGWPAPGLPRRDRYALRGVLMLVLAVAIAIGWRDPLPRLMRALGPDLGPIAAAGNLASLDMWITPPAYTGLPPVFLRTGGAAGAPPAEGSAAADQPIVVPAGSVLLAQLSGGSGTPVLRLGDRETAFARVDATTHTLTLELTESAEASVEQDGARLGRWQIDVLVDRPPTVEFLTPPARTGRAALRLEYTAEDDFGLNAVGAVITRADAGEAKAAKTGLEAIELELALPGRQLRQASNTSFHDLTAHIWAGLPVEIRLEASDSIDQKGVSDPFQTVLPERIFNHPVARAIVEQRKQLTIDAEANAPVVAEVLEGLAARPDHYYGDVVVFLALTTAHNRLSNGADTEGVAAVQELLWNTALRIEDGKLSIAGRDLREAQKRLMEALANQAQDAEIEQLMDELQAALNDFMDAIAEELARQQQSGAMQQMIDPQAVMLDRLDLQEMIERARELARSGARDAARQLLSQLREMLENLRSGSLAQMDQRSRSAWQMLQDLRELIERQNELLDETFRQSQQGEQGRQATPGPEGRPGAPRAGRGTGEGAAGSGRQMTLRRDLGDLVRRLDELTGGIPRAFGRADQSMREAVEALRRGEPGAAVGPQTNALDQLQQGAQALSEQLARQMGMQPLMSGPQGFGQRRGAGRDPFGRTNPGALGVDTSDVRIPNQADLQRTRQILDELRRRAGDHRRPVLELDYIERLLRRF